MKLTPTCDGRSESGERERETVTEPEVKHFTYHFDFSATFKFSAYLDCVSSLEQGTQSHCELGPTLIRGHP